MAGEMAENLFVFQKGGKMVMKLMQSWLENIMKS